MIHWIRMTSLMTVLGLGLASGCSDDSDEGGAQPLCEETNSCEACRSAGEALCRKACDCSPGGGCNVLRVSATETCKNLPAANFDECMQHVASECNGERPPENADHQACETALQTAACTATTGGEPALDLPEACARYAGVCVTAQLDAGSDAASD